MEGDLTGVCVARERDRYSGCRSALEQLGSMGEQDRRFFTGDLAAERPQAPLFVSIDLDGAASVLDSYDVKPSTRRADSESAIPEEVEVRASLDASCDGIGTCSAVVIAEDGYHAVARSQPRECGQSWVQIRGALVDDIACDDYEIRIETIDPSDIASEAIGPEI
jgi:hypothetical protein